MTNYKRIILSIMGIFLILSMCIISFAAEYPCEGIANASSVRVRKKASTSGAQVTTLKKGEAVTVLEENITNKGVVWYKVETEKGKQGYVMSDYLSIPETALIEAAKNSPDAQLMKLEISAYCGNFNNVGKNWTQYYEWNGVQIKDEKAEVFTAPEIELTVYARIREQEQNPDTSTEKTIYVPTIEEMETGFSVVQEITVTEDSGKYKGNSAHWTVTFKFTPIEESNNKSK